MFKKVGDSNSARKSKSLSKDSNRNKLENVINIKTLAKGFNCRNTD